MKIVVCDRDSVFTFEAEDADKEIVFIGDAAIVVGPEDDLEEVES